MNKTMSYKGYTTSMTYDAEDQIIVGRVLDVDDIISFHGESISEFETNFRTVIDDYIAACERQDHASSCTNRTHVPALKAHSR